MCQQFDFESDLSAEVREEVLEASSVEELRVEYSDEELEALGVTA